MLAVVAIVVVVLVVVEASVTAAAAAVQVAVVVVFEECLKCISNYLFRICEMYEMLVEIMAILFAGSSSPDIATEQVLICYVCKVKGKGKGSP